MSFSVIDLLKQHTSIRKFKPTAIPEETLNSLIEAGQCASSSSFIQACTIIHVEDQKNRETLSVLSGNQTYVATAPVFLVFCADMQRHQTACEMHQQQMQSGFTEQFMTATIDCALFAQNTCIAAESLGLGVVYIGGIRNHIQSVSELLALPDLVYPVFGMCIGFPDQTPEAKPRLPLSLVLNKDSYRKPDQTHIEHYDNIMKKYYQNRTGNQKSLGWSEQISALMTKESRPHMLDFLQKKGFLKR